MGKIKKKRKKMRGVYSFLKIAFLLICFNFVSA